MIENMQHTYMQHGEKYYAFLEPVRGEFKVDGFTRIIDAHNFYVFDSDGWCWVSLLHVDLKYVMDQFGNGFFKQRVCYTLDTPMDAVRKPNVDSDEWIKGSFDRGYALETIRGGLGLNLMYLKGVLSSK